MELCDLFDLEGLQLLEGSFEDLTNESVLVHMLRGSKEVRLLISDDETPLAMAREDGEWKAVSFLWKEPSEEIIELLPELDIKVFICSTETYRQAVYDHFNQRLLNGCQSALEDLPPDRVKKVSDLIYKEWSFQPGDLCYDCCCGSGVGSQALSKVGLKPFAFDLDRELLCRGFQEKRLETWNTVLLDATKASQYLERAPFAIMLMAGDINVGNSWIWERVFAQVQELADRLLITVASQEEAEVLRRWAEEKDRKCRVFENTRDPFYDRWVCSLD